MTATRVTIELSFESVEFVGEMMPPDNFTDDWCELLLNPMLDLRDGPRSVTP